MGKLGTIPGVFAFLRPMPVLDISTGATNQNQGQYAYSLSGVNSDQVYDVAQKLMAQLRSIRDLRRFLRTTLITRPILTLISGAIRPARTEFRKLAF